MEALDLIGLAKQMFFKNLSQIPQRASAEVDLAMADPSAAKATSATPTADVGAAGLDSLQSLEDIILLEKYKSTQQIHDVRLDTSDQRIITRKINT